MTLLAITIPQRAHDATEAPAVATRSAAPALKATVQQQELRRGLRIVSYAVAERSALPVLGNILLATDGQQHLKLTATDLHIGITARLEAAVQAEGSITLPAKLLADVVGSLPNEIILLAMDERMQSVHLTCGSFEAEIKGIEAEAFPSVPTISGADAEGISVAAADLRAVAEQVAIVAGTDDTRPVLTGVLMHLKDTTATFVASDGIRLAVRTLTLPNPIATPLEVLIPAQALRDLRRISGNAETITVAVASECGQILFRAGNVELITRLIDGKFPDYARLIPRQYTTRAMLETAELARAVKLATYFAAAAANVVRLALEPGDAQTPGRLTISSNAAEVGEHTGVIDAIIQGPSGQILLNAALLAEAIGTIATPQIAVEIQTQQQPAVFRPVGVEGFIHLMTPMTLR